MTLMTFRSSSSIMKSPVSILHEFLNKTGINAVYELRRENVTKRSLLFHYRLKVCDLEVTATGFSKKQAKQNASEKMLDILYKCPRLFKSMKQNEKNLCDDIVKLHPVQSLHDICMANHWYIPTYEYVGQEGPADNRKFTCVAKIDNIREKGIGIGKSKKLSKANAAYNLIKKLNDQSLDSPEHSASHSSMSYITALRDMAHSNEMQLNLFHLPDAGKFTQKQCLLEVLSNPVIVCSGFGDTREDALNNASMNALHSIRIVVSKYCNK